MAGLNFEVRMPRRRAEVTISSYWARKLGVGEGTSPCHVLGIFQDSGDDGAYPIAVCELDDGRVITVSPEAVKFVDTKEGFLL